MNKWLSRRNFKPLFRRRILKMVYITYAFRGCVDSNRTMGMHGGVGELYDWSATHNACIIAKRWYLLEKWRCLLGLFNMQVPCKFDKFCTQNWLIDAAYAVGWLSQLSEFRVGGIIELLEIGCNHLKIRCMAILHHVIRLLVYFGEG